ncbi:hypothetical protein [Alteromonas sp. a30]|uniref:hypothetical protein n=1 Tax=Alteromonas sp. a30 TaxID=2730917 RepID=UPI00227F8261|nr:hypothetical protein [Alteromonas sp. a30]MCY7295242.1 hypothetical protein [Alteromonas sp. a30]
MYAQNRRDKSARNHRQKRSYRLQKSGVKDEFIDRQILVLHAAIVDKLLKHPELHAHVFSTLEQRLASGKLRYGGYMTWYSLMDNIENETLFRNAVLENTPRMRKLRRSTPFVGILTEEERSSALNTAACGEADISHLLY